MGSSERGRYNSSLTRVRPLFGGLLAADPTGATWLATLLRTAPNADRLPADLRENPGTLVPSTVAARPYEDRVLGTTIDLPGCFERSTPPPGAFLHWLIENLDARYWPQVTEKGEQGEPPRKRSRTYGQSTQERREALVGARGSRARAEMQASALAELAAFGPSKSRRKWWAFEGFTEVDCWLETDRLVLLVEGKRTEALAPSTHWYPARNQLVRNLEVADEQAAILGKWAGVLLVTEATPAADPLTDAVFEAGTPHLTAAARDRLRSRYLGVVTWRGLCEQLDVPWQSLPSSR